MPSALYLGVDLAWRESRPGLPANETGVAVIDATGQVLDAGWRRGVDETLAWADAAGGTGRDTSRHDHRACPARAAPVIGQPTG